MLGSCSTDWNWFRIPFKWYLNDRPGRSRCSRVAVAALSLLAKGALCFLPEAEPRPCARGALPGPRGRSRCPRPHLGKKTGDSDSPLACGMAPDTPLAVKVQVCSQQARGEGWDPHLGIPSVQRRLDPSMALAATCRSSPGPSPCP